MSKFTDLDSDIVILGPLIPFADSRPITAPSPFADAVEHWRLGASAASRIGLIQGLPLRLGLAATGVTAGSGYTSIPTVTLAGAGATGLVGFGDISVGASTLVMGDYTGQPIDDTGAVTATVSGGGGTGGALVYTRGAEPTYNAKSAVLAAGRANGLVSPINDAAVYSEAYLLKRPAANTSQIIAGALNGTTRSRGTAVGGDMVQWITSAGVDTIRHHSAPAGTLALTIPTSWVPGTFGVLLVAQSASGRLVMAFGPDGASTKVTAASVKVVASPQRKRALGGIHYDLGTDYGSNEIASFVNWASALTEAQMSSRAYDMLDYARASALL
jgi:hypothetical protein